MKFNFNEDTKPLFCPECGKCMTKKGIPTDVLEKIGICICG